MHFGGSNVGFRCDSKKLQTRSPLRGAPLCPAAAARPARMPARHTSGADTGHRCSRSLPRSSVLCVVELTWCLRKPKPNLFHALMNNRLHAYALLVVATKPHNKARR